VVARDYLPRAPPDVTCRREFCQLLDVSLIGYVLVSPMQQPWLHDIQAGPVASLMNSLANAARVFAISAF
jgi:hypothetical protein